MLRRNFLQAALAAIPIPSFLCNFPNRLKNIKTNVRNRRQERVLKANLYMFRKSLDELIVSNNLRLDEITIRLRNGIEAESRRFNNIDCTLFSRKCHPIQFSVAWPKRHKASSEEIISYICCNMKNVTVWYFNTSYKRLAKKRGLSHVDIYLNPEYEVKNGYKQKRIFRCIGRCFWFKFS